MFCSPADSKNEIDPPALVEQERGYETLVHAHVSPAAGRKRVPVLVDALLDLLDERPVLRAEQVGEALLVCQPVLDRSRLLRLVGEPAPCATWGRVGNRDLEVLERPIGYK